MIVVDTTVLVYAVGADHLLRAPCRELVRLVGDGTVQATTTVGVLQEFAHVRARRRPREDAARLTRRFATLLGPLLGTRSGDLVDGLALFERHTGLGAFDAVLAAVTANAGACALVSADHGFAEIPGLTALHPADPRFLDEVLTL